MCKPAAAAVFIPARLHVSHLLRRQQLLLHVGQHVFHLVHAACGLRTKPWLAPQAVPTRSGDQSTAAADAMAHPLVVHERSNAFTTLPASSKFYNRYTK